jgi:hypothetical protein
MSKNAKWSAFGTYDKSAKPNLMAQIFAVLTAAQAFSDPAQTYPWLMSALLILGAAWIGVLALKPKAWVGLLIPATSLIWLAQLLGSNPFGNVLLWFFAHVILALLFGSAAYTFMRASKPTATSASSEQTED